ncbi:MAG: putative Ig domain-containing protein [Cetobacterium sp.]
MPEGWAADPSGTDSNGYYSNVVAAWAEIPAYFKDVDLWEPRAGLGFSRGLQIVSGGSMADGENYFHIPPNGLGFAGSTGSTGAGTTENLMTTIVTRGASSEIGRQIFRHEFGHVIDYMTSERTTLPWRTGFITSSSLTYASLGGISIVAYHDIFKLNLPSGFYARSNVVEWWAEFFSYIIVNDVANFSVVCDNGASVPGPVTVKCVNWFNEVFPGWSGLTAPTIISSAPAAGTNGTAYTHTFTASGSARTWSVVAGTLPAGLTLNSTTGVLSGTPSATASYTYTVAATNQAGAVTAEYTTVIAAGSGSAPVVTSQPTTVYGFQTDEFYFVSAATGTPTPTLQWQYRIGAGAWTNVSGATSSSLSGYIGFSPAPFNTQASGSVWDIRAAWTNANGTTYSNVAQLYYDEL